MCAVVRSVDICHREYDNVINFAIKDYKVIYLPATKTTTTATTTATHILHGVLLVQFCLCAKYLAHSRCMCQRRLSSDVIFSSFFFLNSNFRSYFIRTQFYSFASYVERDVPCIGERRVSDDKVYFAYFASASSVRSSDI